MIILFYHKCQASLIHLPVPVARAPQVVPPVPGNLTVPVAFAQVAAVRGEIVPVGDVVGLWRLPAGLSSR